MKGLCIFDFDGTLADTLRSIAYFGNSSLEALGLKAVDVQLYRKMVGNGAVVLLHRMLNASTGKSSEEYYPELKEIYDRKYGEDPSYLVTPYDGMKELLTALKKDGWLLGINSNKPDELTKQIAGKIFGENTFDVIYGQREDIPKKPAPDAVLLMMREFDLTPEKCFYIGDSNVDVETGKNAGICTVGVAWGFRGVDELKSAGADHIVEKAMEIYDILKNK